MEPSAAGSPDSRAAANAEAGRLFFRCLNDAQGYPNGLDPWEAMTPESRYWHAALAATFARALADGGFVKLVRDLGLEGRYGEGDCAALLEALRTDQSSK